MIKKNLEPDRFFQNPFASEIFFFFFFFFFEDDLDEKEKKRNTGLYMIKYCNTINSFSRNFNKGGDP